MRGPTDDLGHISTQDERDSPRRDPRRVSAVPGAGALRSRYASSFGSTRGVRRGSFPLLPPPAPSVGHRTDSHPVGYRGGAYGSRPASNSPD